jgi:hypothetical protein
MRGARGSGGAAIVAATLAALCAAGAAWPKRAAAQPAAAAPLLRVELPACPAPPLSLPAFVGSLRVELAGHAPACCAVVGAEAGAAAAQPAVTLAVGIDCCDGSCGAAGDHVRLSVRDAAGAIRAELDVSLADVPVDARPRALALSAAELLRSTEQPPRPAPPPPAPPAGSASATPGAGRSTPAMAIDVGGTLAIQAHPGRNMLLLGASPSVGVTRARWCGTLSLEAMHGDPSVALGDVPTTLLAVALTVGPELHAGRTRVALGLSGTAGWAHVAGNAAAPAGTGVATATASALVTAVGARTAVDVPLGATGAWSLRALVEGGAMLRGLDAQVNGAPAARLSGAYVLGGLGLGWTASGG